MEQIRLLNTANIEKKLIFVTGKGGVGKSSVAGALSLNFIKQGEKVLLIELEKPSTIRTFFPQSHPNRLLHHLDLKVMDSEESLKEYVLKIIKLGVLYKVAFENKVFQIFLNASPGIKELILLGHIHYLLENSSYDRIVVDMPASGHALEYLEVPKIIAKFMSSGPLFKIAQTVQATLQKSALLYVSLPEELSLSETFDFCEKLKTKLGKVPDFIILNQFFSWRFESEEECKIFEDIKHKLYKYPEFETFKVSIKFLETYFGKSAYYNTQLENKFGNKLVRIPFLFSERWEHKALEEVSTYLK
ncbi:MAG: AAA family ATPase [Deltaproteobacteria bacterium]|nr:AAA family ATPase [Deltaproteobacteria bacterium]